MGLCDGYGFPQITEEDMANILGPERRPPLRHRHGREDGASWRAVRAGVDAARPSDRVDTLDHLLAMHTSGIQVEGSSPTGSARVGSPEMCRRVPTGKPRGHPGGRGPWHVARGGALDLR